MTVDYLDLTDYLAIAAEVTGLDLDTILKVTTSTPLTERCTRRPPGSATPTSTREFIYKAAVLIVGLARNHPLPDGNKRAAWVSLRMFVEVNGWRWQPTPAVDDAEQAVLKIAAGEWDEQRTARWLANHLAPPIDTTGT